MTDKAAAVAAPASAAKDKKKGGKDKKKKGGPPPPFAKNKQKRAIAQKKQRAIRLGKKPAHAKETAEAAGATVAQKRKPKIKKPVTRIRHLWQKETFVKGIGKGVPEKRNLTRFVKWPRYIRLQRQRRILYKRLKVPPAINQFKMDADRNSTRALFALLWKYRTETKGMKKYRLMKAAKKGGKTEAETKKKPLFVKHGADHVTALVEKKKAKLVVIAHDVDPIEVVLFLPALCRKLDVPYMIVKGKSRLGHAVHLKHTSCLAFTEVRPEDASALAALVAHARAHFNNNLIARRKHGGMKLPERTKALLKKRAQSLAEADQTKKKVKVAVPEPQPKREDKEKAAAAKPAKAEKPAGKAADKPAAAAAK